MQEMQREILSLRGQLGSQTVVASVGKYLMRKRGELIDTNLTHILSIDLNPVESKIMDLQKEIIDLRGRVEHHGNAIGSAFNKIDETGVRLDGTISKVSETVERMNNLEEVVEDERNKTIHALADSSERQDFQSNQSKSHCVLVTGG